MEAYAIAAPFDADFADHDWAVENIKNKVGEGRQSDFSSLWTAGRDSDRLLDNIDDAVYFYGGRSAIYEALAAYELARIRNFVDGHRGEAIHVYRAVVKVSNLPLAKTKQIIMLALGTPERDDELSAWRDRDLEDSSGDAHSCRMREFRARMQRKWPKMADD
jgi:hypothetical protein